MFFIPVWLALTPEQTKLTKDNKELPTDKLQITYYPPTEYYSSINSLFVLVCSHLSFNLWKAGSTVEHNYNSPGPLRANFAVKDIFAVKVVHGNESYTVQMHCNAEITVWGIADALN